MLHFVRALADTFIGADIMRVPKHLLQDFSHVIEITRRVILCEKDNFGSDHLKNQLFGPKQVSYTPLGASGPFLTLESHFSVKIGNFWFLGLSGTQNFK